MQDLDELDYQNVAIDRCHVELIKGLALSSKPKRILELGVGSGNCSKVLLDCIEYNQRGTLTTVDNWWDWRKNEPPIAQELRDRGVEVCTEDEHIWTEENKNRKFDFILSDAGHASSEQRAGDFWNMLNPRGILIAHDVTNKFFPNLHGYIDFARDKNLSHSVFNENSRDDERCKRGMIVIFKN